MEKHTKINSFDMQLGMATKEQKIYSKPSLHTLFGWGERDDEERGVAQGCRASHLIPQSKSSSPLMCQALLFWFPWLLQVLVTIFNLLGHSQGKSLLGFT